MADLNSNSVQKYILHWNKISNDSQKNSGKNHNYRVCMLSTQIAQGTGLEDQKEKSSVSLQNNLPLKEEQLEQTLDADLPQ